MVDFSDLGEHLPSDSSVLIFASTNMNAYINMVDAKSADGDNHAEISGDNHQGH